MNPETLSSWNVLSHPQRMRRAYELGLDPQNAPLIDELERGNSFARRLALQTIYGSRDGARAQRLIFDESRLVRHTAVKLVAKFGAPEVVQSVFLGGNEALQRSIVRILVKNRRRDVIDELCIALRLTGGNWQVLSPYASLDFLESHFQTAFTSASTLDWGRLARHHPRLALEKLLEQAGSVQERDNLLLQRVNAVLHYLGDRESDLALELVETLGKFIPLGEIRFAGLLPHRPQAIAELALARDDKLALDFTPYVSKLKFETVQQLLRRRPNTLNGAWKWLKRLPVEKRAMLWTEFSLGWRLPNGALQPLLLACLPRATRHSEALRHLALPTMAALPGAWLPFAAFLEHDEALQRAQPFLGDPDPDLRAAAHRALAHNVRFAREFADELLLRVQSKGNEQDPVRGAMLEGLALVPPSVWREEHLPLLENIQRQALDARDLSSSTSAQLARVWVSLIPWFPAQAAEQLAILVEARGQIPFYNLESRLTDSQMPVVGAQIWPVLDDWARRDHSPFLSAMSSLGRRIRAWDEGAKLLEHFAKNGPSSKAPSAANLLAKYRPDRFASLVPQLLQIDPSWAVIAAVYNHIHCKRQDLLTPALLGAERLHGRFFNGQTRFFLPVRAGFARWNPGQQALWSQTLCRVIRDEQRDLPGVFIAVDRLASLPDVEPTDLLRFASLDNTRAALREAALRVLSRLDGGQGVPLLIEALDDERARIAIYSLRRALLEMPEERALAVLREAPLQKVTVAKEVVRLLGDIKSSGALDLLFEFANRDLHRDVRIALLRGLWEHLDDERAWPILEAAANSEEAAIARMAARTTAPRLSPETRLKLNRLRAGLLSHPETRVRLEVLGALTAGASDPDKVLRGPLFAALNSRFPEEYAAAARAVWSTYSSDGEIVTQAIGKLLPRRKALKAVVNAFASVTQSSRTHADPTGRAILEDLKSDALLLGLRLELAFSVLPKIEFIAFVEEQAASGTLDANVLYDLVILLRNSPLWGENADALTLMQEHWQSAQAPELRRLSLAALMGQARDAHGWTKERVAALNGFKNDASSLVAAAAQWTFPSGTEEEDEGQSARQMETQ